MRWIRWLVCSFLCGLSVRDVEAALEETFEEQIVFRAPCHGSERTAASATRRGAGVGWSSTWAARASTTASHSLRSCRVADDVPWRMVPAAGVWERLHRELRRRLNAAGLIDWTRDRRFKPHSRSSRGSDAPSPVDRGRPGSKHHCETPEALVAGSSPRAVIRIGRLAAAGMTPSTIRPLRGALIGIYLLVAAGANLSSTERESSRRPSSLRV